MKKAVAHLIPFMEAEREASYKLTGEVSQEKVVADHCTRQVRTSNLKHVFLFVDILHTFFT